LGMAGLLGRAHGCESDQSGGPIMRYRSFDPDKANLIGSASNGRNDEKCHRRFL